MDIVETGRVFDLEEWFVVFHTSSTSRFLSLLAFGRYKHVSAFAYAGGFKAWVLYDVTWHGTLVRVLDSAGIMEATRDLTVLKIKRTGNRMRMSSRLGLYCVSSVKHLLRLRCVAATPDQLYQAILRNGGIAIHVQHRPAAGTG